MSDENFNGIDDSYEWSTNDANFNGVDDSMEWSSSWVANDANFNGVDDSMEWSSSWSTNDANWNGVDDSMEWSSSWVANDANWNGVDDSMEWSSSWVANDANWNGVDDSMEWSSSWVANDANFNGVDDSTEWTEVWPINDANLNGIDDGLEWPVNDANFNGVDDSTEWTQVWPIVDANLNGLDDSTEWTEVWPVNDANFNGLDDSTEWAPTGSLPPAVQAIFDATALPTDTTSSAPWENAPADDLGAAIAFAQHVASNPTAHPVLREYAGLDEVVDAIAGPEAIAQIVGVPFAPGMSLDDIALATALRGPFSAETGVPVEQFSLKSGTGLQLNPFFANSAAGGILNGQDDWLNNLVERAAARGDFRPGAGGFDPILQGINVRTDAGTDYARWLQTIWTSNAISAATSPF